MNIVFLILGILSFIVGIIIKDSGTRILGILVIGCSIIFWNEEKKPRPYNTKPNGLYYLNISDSPHVPNVHPELDYTSNDTAYINWYSNNCK